MAYLNYNSTNHPKSGQYNPSDLGYNEVIEMRESQKLLENRILQMVNAPPDSTVIFNSGASESVATLIHWIKDVNPYGTIMGSDFDHSIISDNCINYHTKYLMSDYVSIDDRASLCFLTHINSKTGEIFNVDAFSKMFKSYSLIDTSGESDFDDSDNVLQFSPLIALDATQSIGKLQINMIKYGINAVFFSLHKLGGPIGTGVLVIDNKYKFVPLIAGQQQGGLRGGTYPIENILSNSDIFSETDDPNSRKKTWMDAVNYLEAKGIEVYKPKHKHIYNTILAKTNKCPLEVINELSLEGIYVGTLSACSNEPTDALVSSEEIDSNESNKEIRISFKYANELNSTILEKIANAISITRA